MRWLAAGALVLLLVAGLVALGAGVFPFPAESDDLEGISPEAAAAAEEEIAGLANGREEARLSADQLTSLLRHRPEMWPLSPMHQPRVEMVGETFALSGSVATQDLPAAPEVEAIRYLLPDTATVRVAGTVHSFGDGAAVLQIDALEVAGMPIPARYYSSILDRLGRGGPDQLEDSLVLPLPDGIGSARVENGEMVLTP